MKTRTLAAAVAAASLTVPAAAQAHVTLQPKEAPAGGFTRLDVRVPTESDDASTTKVQVRFPPGFGFVSYEAKPGWTVKVAKRKAAEPIKTDDGELTEEVGTITFTADSKKDAIAPGQFADFGLSVGVPDGDPGSTLTFPALQTYSDGEVVRWIGDAEADKPAPQVTLTASGDHPAAAPAQPAADEGDGKASKGLAIAALIVGGLGLLVGIAGFAAASRRRMAA